MIFRKLIVTGSHRRRETNGIEVHGFFKINEFDQNYSCFLKRSWLYMDEKKITKQTENVLNAFGDAWLELGK